MKKEQIEQMVSWMRLLGAEINTIAYRASGLTAPTPIFYRELAESLEGIAKRVRREINDSRQA